MNIYIYIYTYSIIQLLYSYIYNIHIYNHIYILIYIYIYIVNYKWMESQQWGFGLSSLHTIPSPNSMATAVVVVDICVGICTKFGALRCLPLPPSENPGWGVHVFFFCSLYCNNFNIRRSPMFFFRWLGQALSNWKLWQKLSSCITIVNCFPRFAKSDHWMIIG